MKTILTTPKPLPMKEHTLRIINQHVSLTCISTGVVTKFTDLYAMIDYANSKKITITNPEIIPQAIRATYDN